MRKHVIALGLAAGFAVTAISAQAVIGDNAMQQAAVIPHHQIADAPMMGVDEMALCRMVEQFPVQRSAFRLGHAENMRRVIAEIERLASGIRVGTHQRMVRRSTVRVERRAKYHSQAGDPMLRHLQ